MLYFKLLSIALFPHLLSQFLLTSKLKVSFCFLFLFIYFFIFILGIILILAGQCVSATQMTVEEVFLKKKKFHPLQVSSTCVIMALWCYPFHVILWCRWWDSKFTSWQKYWCLNENPFVFNAERDSCSCFYRTYNI